MKIQFWKFGTPLQAIGSTLWWFSEKYNIKILRKNAHIIFGWMIGCKGKKVSKSS